MRRSALEMRRFVVETSPVFKEIARSPLCFARLIASTKARSKVVRFRDFWVCLNSRFVSKVLNLILKAALS
jgi:hypothetical protein